MLSMDITRIITIIIIWHITTITQVIHLLPMPLVFESFLFFLCFLYFQQSDKYYENRLLITYSCDQNSTNDLHFMI